MHLEETKKVIKAIFSKLGFVLLILLIIIIFIGAVIVALLKSDISASAFSGDYSDYVNLGDYIIKVDEEGAMPALTKEQLKTAINKCYSGQARNNCLSVLDDLISVQNKYKVNAAFMIAVAQKESTCGTGWDAINPNSHNWFSILYGSKWNGASGKTCTGGVGTWCWYDSFNEAVQKYGIYMTEHDYFYFSHGEYTVTQIAPHFAGAEWERGVKGYLDDLYSAVAESLPQDSGTQNNGKYTYRGHTYTLFNQNNYTYPFGVGRTISSSGCGVTSIAICVSGFKKGEDPISITKHCHEQKRIYIYI